MNFNQICRITIGTFHAGLSIQQLFLNNNKVKLLETHCLDNLTSLEWLKLNKNKLSHLPKPLFEKLSQLKHLEMSRNKLSIIEGLSFLGLDNLQNLLPVPPPSLKARLPAPYSLKARLNSLKAQLPFSSLKARLRVPPFPKGAVACPPFPKRRGCVSPPSLKARLRVPPFPKGAVACPPLP
ncbi:unnamed protein product [Acanthosepion pharaonis]|uniref:Uncharacterized protein n=1 Tax=Acanthosepion pharaonis TaxID=158019 RepID=A0A812DHD3_ACAPH|nr:unnamed protein product [Sepia pharaonis]